MSGLSTVFLTGDNLIQTNKGNVITKDAIVLRTTGAGDFAEVNTIVGGTGDWSGVTGQFSAVGTFTSAGGKGNYSGGVSAPSLSLILRLNLKSLPSLTIKLAHTIGRCKPLMPGFVNGDGINRVIY